MQIRPGHMTAEPHLVWPIDDAVARVNQIIQALPIAHRHEVLA